VARNRQKEVTDAVADVDFDKNDYRIDIETTMGNISLNLLPDVAPGHCRNMIGLAKIGFYDNLIFHRVIEGFMIQGGCPDGNGTGGPGYNIDAEFNQTPHEPGVLSMARSTSPNSAGSQFFVCLERQKSLDGEYTAFGKTADEASMETVRRVGSVPVSPNDRPREDVKITSAKVVVTPK